MFPARIEITLVDDEAERISKQIEDKEEQTMYFVTDDHLLKKRSESEKDKSRYALP